MNEKIGNVPFDCSLNHLACIFSGADPGFLERGFKFTKGGSSC